MQNSLDRLFEGLSTTLRDTVAPAVDDPYVKSQVLAAVELINNIATRVDWRREPAPEVAAARAELARLTSAPIAELQRMPSLAAEVRTALDRYLRAELDAELAQLRTGMYRRPS